MKIIYNIKGMSLIEVMISTAILSGTIAAMTTFMAQQYRGANNLVGDINFTTIAAQIRYATYNPSVIQNTITSSPDANFKACMGNAVNGTVCTPPAAGAPTSIALYQSGGVQLSGTAAAPLRFGRDGNFCTGACVTATVGYPFRLYTYYQAACSGVTFNNVPCTVNNGFAANALRIIYYVDQDPTISGAQLGTAGMRPICNDPTVATCLDTPVTVQLPIVASIAPGSLAGGIPIYTSSTSIGPSSLKAPVAGATPNAANCNGLIPSTLGTIFTMADGGIGVCSKRNGVTAVYQIGGTSSAGASDSTNFGTAATGVNAFVLSGGVVPISKVLPNLPGMYVCPIMITACVIPWGLGTVKAHIDPNPGCNGQIQGKPFCVSGCNAAGAPTIQTCTRLF